MRKLLLLLIFVFGILNLKAQYFQTGQDPASIKWRQINSENFQFIYPDYYELEAQKLANVFEKVYAYKSNSVQHKPNKISIILHTQTVQSNGLVAWAPKRSELYTTPHQAIYPQDWLQQLALHEFRHIVQIDKVDTELPKIIKIILGEQGTAGVFGLYLPWWFIEGDAVVTETALSNYGRGRFPSFLMEHRAQVVEKGIYKYDKAYNGSVKDFVPDHYKLGYYMVGATREKYGVEIWDSVLNRVGRKPFSLNPFNKELKLQTGFNKVELYNSIFENYKNTWLREDEKFKSVPSKQISNTNKSYSNYKYNHWLNDSTILSYKTSLSEIPSFVKIDNKGAEIKLVKPGRIFDESVNFRGDWIVWSEQKPDLRWSHSGESIIRLFNVENSGKRKVIPEFKAFAPSISPNLENVIVVETDFSNNYYLSVYNILSGKLVHRIQSENNNYFFSPDWINNKEIVAVVLLNEGKRLARFDLNTGKMKLITENDLCEIKHLKVHKNLVFFVSSYSGKNGIYKLNLNNNKIQQIVEPRFGAEYPAISPNDKKLVFSDYTSNGFRLLEIPLSKTKSIPIKDLQQYKYQMADNLAAQESGVIDFSEVDTLKFESKKYSKSANLFNFHSWAPVSIDANSYDITPGISFLSQNRLGTSLTTLGYEWDVSEKTGKVYGKYTYKGWFPMFDIEVSTGKRASKYQTIHENNDGHVNNNDTTLERFTWQQTNFEFGARIPFNLSEGKYTRLLQPEVSYAYTLYNHDNTTPEQFYKGNYQILSYKLYYQQLLRKSAQDVYPNFGFIAEGNLYHTPIGKAKFGTMVLGQSYLYLPGIMENHGTRLFAGFHKKQQDEEYSFSDVIRYPRGWGKINSNEMLSLTFDYKLPLFYPEWSAWGLAYLKRVNTSLFADYAKLKGNYYENGNPVASYVSTISSFGIELVGDMHFMRFYAPLEVGFRASYLPEIKDVNIDFLISINFHSL